MYADDTALFFADRDAKIIESVLQDKLNVLSTTQ